MNVLYLGAPSGSCGGAPPPGLYKRASNEVQISKVIEPLTGTEGTCPQPSDVNGLAVTSLRPCVWNDPSVASEWYLPSIRTLVVGSGREIGSVFETLRRA